MAGPLREPLVVILGSTGTGKSELAVELATRFHGEIINADAMQLYQGLPIITNKIPLDEQRGVPHHLLGRIDLASSPWDVSDFRREAGKTIREIRSRGKLPIVVGGTNYYVDALLFPDAVLDDASREGETDTAAATGEKEEEGMRYPLLREPTDILHAKLREVDPVMAAKWHPNDRRKISRSLAIWLQTGRPASEIYAEQRARGNSNSASHEEGRKGAGEPGSLASGSGNMELGAHQVNPGMPESDGLAAAADDGDSAPWQALLFWVHADPEALRDRVTRRVDNMLAAGLVEETREMYRYLQAQRAEGHDVPLTKGIWQSIGFKQFEPYLAALDQSSKELTEAKPIAEGRDAPGSPDLDALKAAALEQTKGATRRYAKYQVRWITFKLIPRLKAAHQDAMSHLFLVDSTDLSAWKEKVVAPAAEVMRQFLETGRSSASSPPLPSPLDLSEAARRVLLAASVADEERPRVPCNERCDVCEMTFVIESEWKRHMSSQSHKRRVAAKKRRALVPYLREEGLEARKGRKAAETGNRETGDRSDSSESDDLAIDFSIEVNP